MRIVFPAAVLMLAACAAMPPASPDPVVGQWGGTHIGLTLGPSGGPIEYDCAAGRITEPLVPRRDGSFAVAGTHTPGHGGPDRQGEVLPTFKVQFTGAVRGNRMTMQGRVENGVLLGPFALRRGAQAGIFRCL
jgi:hypothetical protein